MLSIFNSHLVDCPFPSNLINLEYYPLLLSFTLLVTTLSAVISFHGYSNGILILLLGLFSTLIGMSLWFKDVTSEATSQGPHTNAVTKDFKLEDIPQNLRDIIIGLALGDLHISCPVLNSRLCFKGSIIYREYILHLYSLFSVYCGTAPSVYTRPSTGDVSVSFNTLTYAAFNFYYELFYVNGVKIVPPIIGQYLTAVSLAYWYMDDGTAGRFGYLFCTDSFSYEDVCLLINVLKTNFDLDCSIHTRKGRTTKHYRIYVKSNSVEKFVALVKPHMHSSMLYKLTLRGAYKDS